MRLDQEESSQNVEDRRGMRAGGVGRGLAGGGIGMIILVLAALFFGVDPSVVMQGVQQLEPPRQEQASGPRGTSPADDEMKQFISKVLGSTEAAWGKLFAANGQRYPAPTLVLFSGTVNSACGFAQAATGPFYCPADQKLYIDLSFYRDLKRAFQRARRFRAGVRRSRTRSGTTSRTCSASCRRSRRMQQRAERERGEQSLDPPRAAGRLFRRHLGEQRQSRSRHSRVGRCRRGLERGGADRRRPRS